MRVYGYGTASFYTYLILMLARIETSQDKFGKHYRDQRQKPDKGTISYSKTVQLYSKSSGKFVQVLKKAVNASGLRDNDAAILTIESESFGKVRIKHYKSHYYICMNAKGDIIGLGEKKGSQMKRCVFRSMSTKDGYTKFISDKIFDKEQKNERYLAFRNTGEAKHYTKVEAKRQRASKFLMMTVEKKRNVKRNIQRRRINLDYFSQERNKHKKRQSRRICLRYLRCLRKAWKLKRRRRRPRVRCRRVRRNYCKCKCTKQ